VRIVIMYNPVSGAGRATQAAESTLAALRERGHDVATVASRLESTAEWLDPALKGAEALVIAGGDGAMRLAAPAACRTQTPVFHLPLGTENLFAREFEMRGGIETLLQALQARRVRRVDVGVANGRLFLLMASVGFDAEVVHTLAASRGGRISHFTYIKPILSTMRTWTPPALSIEIDGRTVIDGQTGMVVVANSRQYGWRIDPAVNADMADGVLDVIFMPARSLMQLVAWAVRCRMRRQLAHASTVTARGRSIVIRSDRPQHFQLDGDPPGFVKELLPDGFEAAGWPAAESADGQPLELRVGIVPQRLPVLTAG